MSVFVWVLFARIIDTVYPMGVPYRNFLFSTWQCSSLIPLSQQPFQAWLNDCWDKTLEEQNNWTFQPISSFHLEW